MDLKNLTVSEKKWKSLYMYTESFYFDKSPKIFNKLYSKEALLCIHSEVQLILC